MTQFSPLILVMLAALIAQAYSKDVKPYLKHCINPEPRYKRIEDFTVKWFRDHIRDEVLSYPHYKGRDQEAPFYNALFYTRGMSEIAKKYACNESLITIWEPWDADLYNSSADETNLFSCIHHNNATRNIFFERMSEAFATKASGSVHVMHDPADYHKPPMNGIWGKIEQKVLRNRVHVVKISRQSGTDKKTIQVIWEQVTGWVEGMLATYYSDQIELKRKLRKRGEPTQEHVEGDNHAHNPRCDQLPVNMLPVDW